MYEIAQFVTRKSRYSTAIIKNPAGAKVPYSIAGSVPMSVCNYKSGMYGTPHALFNSEEEAKQALIGIGLPFFQLADCSWFPRKPETPEDTEALDKFWNS
jgi:hypothetical protein